MKELQIIQQRLNAPKNQYNAFGKYAYRSCEDILMAVKPLLAETECTLTCNDEIVLVGDRFYVKSTFTLTNKDGKSVSASAFAREQDKVTGQIEAQITGAASSYARKYTLNALFAIDDNKDPDATNTHGKTATKTTETPKTKPVADTKADDEASALKAALEGISKANNRQDLVNIHNQYKAVIGRNQQYLEALNQKATEFKKK